MVPTSFRTLEIGPVFWFRVLTHSHRKEDHVDIPVEDKNDNDPVQDDVDEHIFAGQISQGKLCLDTLSGRYGSKIGLFKCTGAGGNQFWFIKKNNNVLQNRDFCAEAQVADGSVDVSLEKCMGGLGQVCVVCFLL